MCGPLGIAKQIEQRAGVGPRVDDSHSLSLTGHAVRDQRIRKRPDAAYRHATQSAIQN
jgi:hypothetical protein